MGDFLHEYFHLVYCSDELSQRRLGNFVEAIQTYRNHPEFGPRILVFGILCGAIVYEDDEKGYGSSQSASRMLLACLKAVVMSSLAPDDSMAMCVREQQTAAPP